MEKQFKLGVDLHESEDLLSGFTFEGVIDMCYSNLGTDPERVTKAAVRKEISELLDAQMKDFRFLLENNLDEIVNRVRGGGQ